MIERENAKEFSAGLSWREGQGKMNSSIQASTKCVRVVEEECNILSRAFKNSSRCFSYTSHYRFIRVGFQRCSRVVDQYRSRLSPSTIEALICTQDWLRQDYYIDYGVDSSSSSNLLNDEILIGECLAE